MVLHTLAGKNGAHSKETGGFITHGSSRSRMGGLCSTWEERKWRKIINIKYFKPRIALDKIYFYEIYYKYNSNKI